jgi:hypothetical protein
MAGASELEKKIGTRTLTVQVDQSLFSADAPAAGAAESFAECSGEQIYPVLNMPVFA